MGAGTAMQLPGCSARVAIAGFPKRFDAAAPFLAIASENDGAVPMAFVEDRVRATASDVVALTSAPPASWPRRASLFFRGADAPCHVSFMAPDVNDRLQSFLGPLLPVARLLSVPVLDFDKHVRRADIPLMNRGDAAAATRICRKNEWRRRRGRDAYSPARASGTSSRRTPSRPRRPSCRSRRGSWRTIWG